MSLTLSSIRSILDFPDEILILIASHLNARERVALGNSCHRLNSLVFGDKELLSDLDFSKEGRLTSYKDIAQYFSNENIYKHVYKTNIRNVTCMQAGKMLNNSIGKATNLVDVNIHGTIFKNIQQLGDFLEPLVNLRRLSVDWPEVTRDDAATCCDLLEQPFSRLTYLSLDMRVHPDNFLPTAPLCQELEELRVDARGDDELGSLPIPWGFEGYQLANLKIVQFCGFVTVHITNNFISLLPDKQEWTEFLLIDRCCDDGFYYEKNVDICMELQNIKTIQLERHPGLSYVGFYLIPGNLLREVVKITHEDAPESFCCLATESESEIAAIYEQTCLLKIDEAKRLLKDPNYEISFLQFIHHIHPDCDAHLLASAFPNLTVLIFAEIIREKDKMSIPRMKKHCRRRLSRKDNTAPEEQDDPTNVDSSFEMLVENTPHVRDLSICGNKHYGIGSELWDLDALYVISRWKNLTTLRLQKIPLIDGNFLIDIGKECPQLETIMLHSLGQSNPCCWTSGLSRMLKYCRNLTEFSIYQCWPFIDDLSEVLTSLCSNVKLTTLRTVFDTKAYDFVTMTSCVEQLLRRCSQLTTFLFIVDSLWGSDAVNLHSAIERIIKELNRPNFQFKGPGRYWDSPEVYEDAPTSFFPGKWDGFYYP